MADVQPAGPAVHLWRLSCTLSAFLELPSELNSGPFDLVELTQCTNNLTVVIGEALQGVKTLNDSSIDQGIGQAQRLCLEFARLIQQDTRRLGIPVSDWGIPEAEKLHRDIKTLAKLFKAVVKQYADFTTSEGHRIVRGLVEPDADAGPVAANSGIPEHWVPVIRWMKKQFSVYDSHFLRWDLNDLFPMDGFENCMSFLESLGAIEQITRCVIYIQIGNGEFMDETRIDGTNILPTILTHPDLRIVNTTATQAAGPPIVPTVSTPPVWSHPRIKAKWLPLLPKGRMSDDVWRGLLEKAQRDGHAENPPGNPKLWKFSKAFCKLESIACPDFSGTI